MHYFWSWLGFWFSLATPSRERIYLRVRPCRPTRQLALIASRSRTIPRTVGFEVAHVEVTGRNVYRVHGQDIDDDALVFIEWHRTQEEVVMKCGMHHVYVGLNSEYPSPCVCIKAVREYRRSAFLTDNKDIS